MLWVKAHWQITSYASSWVQSVLSHSCSKKAQMSMEYRSSRHREILTVCKLWPCPFDTDQVVSDNMKSYEKNTCPSFCSHKVPLQHRLLYQSYCWFGSSKSFWIFSICSGQMQMVRQQSPGPGLAAGKNGLLSCVGERNGEIWKTQCPAEVAS